eukprot:6891198-Heterocapsa_arctica.AAC.1
MEACPKVLETLSGDDAHDLFTKLFNFVHLKSKTLWACCNNVFAVIAVVAMKFTDPCLSMMVYKVKLAALAH